MVWVSPKGGGVFLPLWALLQCLTIFKVIFPPFFLSFYVVGVPGSAACVCCLSSCTSQTVCSRSTEESFAAARTLCDTERKASAKLLFSSSKYKIKILYNQDVAKTITSGVFVLTGTWIWMIRREGLWFNSSTLACCTWILVIILISCLFLQPGLCCLQPQISSPLVKTAAVG